MRNKFGITPEQYWEMYEAQGRKCYGCQRAAGKDESGRGRTPRLAVDHDHKTGKIRGLLCRLCNRDVLGHFGDDPEALRRLADYVENPPAVAIIGEVVVPGGPG